MKMASPVRDTDDIKAYENYRWLRRTIASFSELQEKVRKLYQSVTDTESFHPIVEICLSIVEDYNPYHASRVKLDLLNRFYGVDDTNDEALETIFDAIEQVDILIHTGGIADKSNNRSSDTIYEALVSLKSGLSVLLKSVDDDSTLTSAVASKNSSNLEDKWKVLCETVCTHPCMGNIVRNNVNPVGRALQVVDSTLQIYDLDSDTHVDMLKIGLHVTPPYSILPPLRCAGDGKACCLTREGEYFRSIVNTFLVGQGDGSVLTSNGQKGPATERLEDLSDKNGSLRPGLTIAVVGGAPGCGKSSLALSVAHSVRSVSSTTEGANEVQELVKGGSRYDFVRWMHGAGCAGELYTDWVRLACALGVYEHVSQSEASIMTSIDTNFRPSVPFPQLVQMVYAAVENMNYLLIFDGVSSYEAICSFLPPRHPTVLDSAIPAPAHHILITTCSALSQWEAATPNLTIEVYRFCENESISFLSGRSINRHVDSEDEVGMALLKSRARELHSVTDGNPLALSLSTSAIVMCSKSDGVAVGAGMVFDDGAGSNVGKEVTEMNVVSDFLARVHSERGEEFAGVTTAEGTTASSCCLPFLCRKKASADRRGGNNNSSPSSNIKQKYQPVATSPGGSSGFKKGLVSPSVSIAIHMMADKLNDETCFPVASRKMLGFIGFMNHFGIPRLLLEELMGLHSEDVVLAGLRPLEEAMLIRSENDSSSRYMIHPLVQSGFSKAITGIDIAGQGKNVMTRFSLSSLLDLWIEPLVIAWSKLYGASSHRHDRLVKWGNHTLVLVRFLDKLDLSQQHHASDMNLSMENYGVVPEMVRLLDLRRRAYLLLARSCGAQGVLREGTCFCRYCCYPHMGLSLFATSVGLHVMRKHLESMRAVPRSGKFGVDEGLAASLHCLAGFYAVSGKLSTAYSLYIECLQCFDEAYNGTDALEYPFALRNYGLTCKALGKTGKAIQAYKKLLEWEKKEYAAIGGNHLSLSLTLYSIGNLYKTLGKYEEAREYYHESLAIEKRLFAMGTHSEAELVKALNNMGNIYYRMGCHEEALVFYLDSLERSRRLYTSNHDDVARTLYNCGNVQFLSQDKERALLSFQEALRIIYHLHGEEYPEAGKILNNIGNVLMSLERFKRAVDTFKSALKIKQLHAAGQYLPDVTMTMTNLASAHICLGETSEALLVYEKCLAYERAGLPEDDPEISDTLELISQLKNLGERRENILRQFREYVNERSSHRKTGLGVSKQDKLNAAAFVIAYAESPSFKTLQHIKVAPGFDNHCKALTNGSLGELFEKCCRI